MKPTLFIEDFTHPAGLPITATEWRNRLARALPRRCPMKSPSPTCSDCGGAGFLYPNPPDDGEWDQGGWEFFIRAVWRVLGIVDTE